MSEFSSSLRQNNIPLYVLTSFCLSIRLSMDTWVASTLWIFVSHATMNIDVQTFLWVPAFNYFGSISRSRRAWSYDNSIFNFFEELLYCLHSRIWHFKNLVANIKKYLGLVLLLRNRRSDTAVSELLAASASSAASGTPAPADHSALPSRRSGSQLYRTLSQVFWF